MRFLRYLKDIKILLILIFTIMMIVNTVISLDPNLSNSIENLVYINILVLVCTIVYILIDFNSYKKKIDELIFYINNLDKENNKIESDYIYKSIKKIIKEYERESKNLKNELEEINDYMTNWIHEIKIPISVLEIIGKRAYELEKSLSKDISVELSRIDKLVEQAMYSSRAGNYNSDFFIKELNLEKIVKEVVKKNKYQFIHNKIDLRVTNLNFNVLTDKKWITHIIELIIDNAIKYSNKSGKIKIYVKENNKGIELHIKDYGIGILPQDIERVFDKGFTGENGRKRTKSTGMGLYISKKILNKLSHDINVASTTNEFCDVYITFYKLSDYFNVT